MHALTGGPSFPGKPCVPFFPWGPYQTKVSQLTVTLSHQSEKPNCKCLTFSPGSPTNPWGPGKPCRRDGALLFLCMHLCNWDIFITFSVLFSARTRIPGLPCCPGAPMSPGVPCFKQTMISWEVFCYQGLLSTTFTILTMFPFEPWTPSIPRMPCEDRKEDS